MQIYENHMFKFHAQSSRDFSVNPTNTKKACNIEVKPPN